ncbi:hypothetical protein NpNSSI1_00008941 [Neofusicoccum parvum]|nr:hypothetical protein NpNSSI1_00008941 [Neofusicoccum parvum]
MTDGRPATAPTPTPAPQRRETRAAARREGEPEFQLPFHGPRLMELWERQLGLRAKDILRWIECDEVKQYLLYWVWVFFSVLRHAFNRGYKDEINRLAQQVFERQGETLSPDSDRVWIMMRKRLIDHAADAMKVPFAERTARLNERAQSMVNRDNASFHDVWTTVSLKLVTLGSNDMGVTKPFYGKDSDTTTCRSVVFELLKSLMDELDFRHPRQKYFENLLNLRCYPLGDGSSTLLPFKARLLVDFWELAMPNGPDSQQILPWIHAEYVVDHVCTFLVNFSPHRAPSFIAAMQDQVTDETIAVNQEDEPSWDTVQMHMGNCFRGMYKAGIQRWADVTAGHLESLEHFRPWMQPWFAAVFALCAEGSTHMALDRPFYGMDLGEEKCADVCFHLLRKAYRNVVLSRENGYWVRALRKRAPEEAAQWTSLQGNIGDGPFEESCPERGVQTTTQESSSQVSTLSDPPGSTDLRNDEVAHARYMDDIRADQRFQVKEEATRCRR